VDDDEEFMGTGEGSSRVDEGGAGSEIGEGKEEGDDDESYSEDEGMNTTPPTAQPRRNPKHLPDHLFKFAAAFSQAEKANLSLTPKTRLNGKPLTTDSPRVQRENEHGATHRPKIY